MKLTEDMVVKREIVSEFFEEDFLDTDDAILREELKAYAESLGFDADMIEKAIQGKLKDKKRVVEAPPPFPVIPQKQRVEARKRFNEEVNRTAKLLLNRVGLKFAAKDLSLRILPGQAIGNNFAAAVQLVNNAINKKLGIKSGQKGKLKTEDFIKAKESLEEVLDSLTRLLKKRISENG
jgi:hypothetical protein